MSMPMYNKYIPSVHVHTHVYDTKERKKMQCVQPRSTINIKEGGDERKVQGGSKRVTLRRSAIYAPTKVKVGSKVNKLERNAVSVSGQRSIGVEKKKVGLVCVNVCMRIVCRCSGVMYAKKKRGHAYSVTVYPPARSSIY